MGPSKYCLLEDHGRPKAFYYSFFFSPFFCFPPFQSKKPVDLKATTNTIQKRDGWNFLKSIMLGVPTITKKWVLYKTSALAFRM